MKLNSKSSKNSFQAIVVSFHHKWIQDLQQNQISVVFRKRGPRSFQPKWIYVYACAPISAIIGRLEIKKYDWLSVEEALKLTIEGRIEKNELLSYAQDYESLAVFTVGAFKSAKRPLSRIFLNGKYGFHPPQTFLRLSLDGQNEIDKLGGLD
jgi:predicted transcriptional regulator